jgi:iron complex outermembrane recepter protein
MKPQIHLPIRLLLVVLLLCIFSLPSFSQTTRQLRLLDQKSGQPIIAATFHHDSQQGVSDENGLISFVLVENARLQLSHVLYGKWFLTPEELKLALERGSVSRTEQVINLQPVSVISLKMTSEKDDKIQISDQERLHHDAGAILNLNPAVASIRKSGAFGFDPVMRGFKYEQLNVVVDGLQSANAACPNRMDPPTSQIALNRIKQIEILKGPHALRYGIGLGGTINFIQESPNFNPSPGAYGRLSSMYESNGQVFRNEGRVGFSGQNHDIGILGSWSQGSDYLDGNGAVVPAEFRRGTIGMYSDFKLNASNLIQVNVNRNFARDVDFPSLGMDLRSDDTWMGNVRHTRYFNGRPLQTWTTSGYFTLVDHFMDNFSRELNPRMMNASTAANTQNIGARTEGFWLLGKGKLYGGGDIRHEAAQGQRAREFLMGPNMGKTMYDNAWQDSRIDKLGVFASYQLPIGISTLSLAGRLDANKAQANDIAGEFTQVNQETEITQLNPGLSVGLQRDLGNHFHGGVWLARVKRSGSLTERFINYFPVGVDPYEMVGNPTLLPEANNQADLILGFHSKSIEAEVNFFAAYLTDYITAVKTDLKPRIATSPGVRQFVNVDQALKTGFELSFRQNLAWGLSQQLMVAYTYGQNLVLSEALPEIAPLDFRYALLGNYLDGKLQTAIRLRHVTGQDRVSESFGEKSTPKFTLFDVDASYNFTANIGMKLGVQNLFDQAYYEHLNRPIGTDRVPLYAPGRNIYVMLRLTLP